MIWHAGQTKIEDCRSRGVTCTWLGQYCWCELPLRLVGKLDAELQCIKQHLIALVYIYEEKASV